MENWPENKQWHEGLDYWTGDEESLEAWTKQMKPPIYNVKEVIENKDGSQTIKAESSVRDTEQLRKYSMLKITNQKNAEKIIDALIDDMDWEITPENWHSFIGKVRKRTNHKLDGKMANQILRKKVT